MKRTKLPPEKERRSLRVSLLSSEPVRLLLDIDDTEIDPVVVELAPDGARLKCVKHFDLFYEGQILGPAILELDESSTPVYAAVKWKRWPEIGVEFLEMSQGDRERIFRFLFRIQRQNIRSVKNTENRPAKDPRF